MHTRHCRSAVAGTLLCLVVLAAPASAEKYALLVGVDDYAPAGESDRDLSSCEMDALLMYNLLASKYGFPADNIRVLLSLAEGREATGDNIVTAFRDHLVRQAGPDDTVVFYFSGHGTQLNDASGDELDDGRDEAVVPADVADTNTVLSDDNLDFLLEQLDTRHVTVIVDSCHAGTVTRAGPIGAWAKTIPFDERFRELPAVKRAFPKYEPPSRPPPAKAGWALDAAGPEVLLAACQPWELSSAYGMTFTVGEQQRRASLMTSHLYHVLTSVRAEAGWAEVLRLLRIRMSSSCDPEQNPVLEGPGAQRPFSAGEAPAPTAGAQSITRPASALRVLLNLGEGTPSPLPDLGFVTEVAERGAADVVVYPGDDEGYVLAGPVAGGSFEVAQPKTLSQALWALFQFRSAGAVTNPWPTFTASLRPADGQKSQVRLGDRLELVFSVSVDAYASLCVLAPDGTLRFALKDEPVKAGRSYELPSEDLPKRVAFQSSLPGSWSGTGLVKLIATRGRMFAEGAEDKGEPDRPSLEALAKVLGRAGARRRKAETMSSQGWAEDAVYFRVVVPEE